MDWTYNTIWFEQLPPGAYAKINCADAPLTLDSAGNATYINLWNFKAKRADFQALDGITTAKYLELNLSNIKSFAGIGKLGPIKRLELSYCRKLESDNGLGEVAESLEWLHIDTSAKFSPGPELCSLRELKVLCLNSCGPIKDLRFLESMPQLLDFRFVNTSVLNGDLTPLMEHPTLVSAAFFHKRHYNIKRKDVDAHLRTANELSREYVHKGDFRTFRYKSCLAR